MSKNMYKSAHIRMSVLLAIMCKKIKKPFVHVITNEHIVEET
jgi:hypothetical protein